MGVCVGAVGWGTALQAGKSRVRFPTVSLEFFYWHNPSSRTMALGLTQPLREMSKNVKVKQSRYRPEEAQIVDRCIAYSFVTSAHRSRCVISITPWSLYPQERPGTYCTGAWVGPRAGLDVCEKSRPHGAWSPDRPARNQSLYRLRYPAYSRNEYQEYILGDKGGRCVRLTTLPPSCADCLEILESQTLWTLQACPGL
jgi:hypothetical protein